MTEGGAIRPSAVAGTFYPSDPGALRRTIEDLIRTAGEEETGSIDGVVGAVVPHAGYVYSGLTAAYAYACLSRVSFDTAVIVGPSHREFFRANSAFDGAAFRTPLGDVPVDIDLRRKIVANGRGVLQSMHGHGQEHAIEVQIPFLQVIKPGVRIVPITMGVQDSDRCAEMAESLGIVMKQRGALLIASSDLSHYHAYQEATRLDARARSLIETMDDAGFQESLDSERVEACGGGPIWVAMHACKSAGAGKARILHACNSGDVSGDRSSVVGYLSAVFKTS